MVEAIHIENREQWLAMRQRDVTASAIGALLGVHDFTSAFALWALKSGLTEEDPEETAPMRRGRLLEPVALAMLAEERPNWKIEEPKKYFRDPIARIGATPDAIATDENGERIIVQVKTAEAGVFRRKWKDPETGEINPPLWIVVQAITEAMLTGCPRAVVVVMVVGFGLDLHVIDIPVHEGIWARIQAEVETFWTMVENRTPPDPDFARDGSTIARMYGQDDGTEIDLSANNRLPELLAERARLKSIEAQGDDAAKDRKAIDTELLLALGTATRGRLADGTVIEAKTVRRGEYVAKATSYRSLKVRVPPGAAIAAPVDIHQPF